MRKLFLSLALAAAAAGAHAAVTATQLMDWAETRFPALFPGHPANATLGPFVYRYYAPSGNYLGLAGTDIYVYGNITGAAPSPVRVGRIADFACQVQPLDCAWLNHARDAQHDAVSGGAATQAFGRIAWRTDVDLQPVYRPLVTGDPLNTLNTGHYGSPVITQNNTVIVPVRVNQTPTYRIEARSGVDGTLKWQAATDYISPVTGIAYGPALTPNGRVYYAGAGGKLFYRDNVDGTPGPEQTVVFYGNANYAGNQAAMDAALAINTPLLVDAGGTVYFGFQAGSNPLNIAGGIARVDAGGSGSWVSAQVATGDSRISKSPAGATPALSLDGRTLYAAMASTQSATTGRSVGYLVALDSSTLAVLGKVALADAATGGSEVLTDRSSGGVAVAPDGDVFFGVLGDRNNTARHPSHGWLLHFDAALTTLKTPGGFGWDHTPSFVAASLVGGYTGASPYLVVSKYNNYSTGQHRMAVLDPRQTQQDAASTTTAILKEVITVLSPTQVTSGSHAGELNEWCIDTAAVDPVTASVFMNSSDGYLYRWRLSDNTLAERINLNQGYYESYTPTAIGPDGRVYSINNAVLNAVGQ